MTDQEPPIGTPTGGLTDPWVGQTIAGKYMIQRRVARGGMARIYRAVQLPLDRTVAIKLLDPTMDSEQDAAEFRSRFLREASTCARLRHPNTVTVFDYGVVEETGSLYMVMEFVEGLNLAQELRRGPLRPERAVWIAHEVCRSLQEAHDLGIVHRDLKASNLMLTTSPEGEAVKVVDFGIAKQLEGTDITVNATVIGTPRYMAPEVIMGQPVDARIDLYSLGVVLYEMLTGKPPFVGESTVKTLMAQVQNEAPPLRENCPEPIPESLVRVVESLLAKSPDDRPAGAGVLRAELHAVLCELGSDRSESVSLSPERGGGAPTLAPSETLVSGFPAPAPAATPTPAKRRLTPTPAPQAQPRAESLPSLMVGLLVLSLVTPTLAMLGTAVVGYAILTRTSAPAAPQATPAAVLTLTSSPSGAEVRENGEPLGFTPLNVPFSTFDGSRTFELSHPGYTSMTLIQGPSTESVWVEAVLQPAPGEARPAAHPASPGDPSAIPTPRSGPNLNVRVHR